MAKKDLKSDEFELVEESKEKASKPLISSYPSCIYHKDYNPQAPEQEKHLKTHSKIVHSEEEMKNIGSDWGVHPSLK